MKEIFGLWDKPGPCQGHAGPHIHQDGGSPWCSELSINNRLLSDAAALQNGGFLLQSSFRERCLFEHTWFLANASCFGEVIFHAK